MPSTLLFPIDMAYFYMLHFLWSGWLLFLSLSILWNPAETDKPIVVLLGGQTHVSAKNHMLSTIWRIRLNLPFSAMMRPYVKLL